MGLCAPRWQGSVQEMTRNPHAMRALRQLSVAVVAAGAMVVAAAPAGAAETPYNVANTAYDWAGSKLPTASITGQLAFSSRNAYSAQFCITDRLRDGSGADVQLQYVYAGTTP